ncbi:hypothetical protein BerOc1_00668 [Pseudodesulfovibrio hydrargyri]|uniref:KAP family P-loop domain protein n=1 Tax=Pseudodesulfovibrio hydrargyri TaxID=2125990 RepID=A0A1J5N1Q6_9BACT|nr:hypothetical protein [Pseudodesulfovibrio hydrargyri]OIQ52194.1 hypothetical protein BerOc1_00668 [Pseudodesulfovibrio hydrargyri]
MSMHVLHKYFKSGDAQAERDIRDKIFIKTKQYEEIFDFSFGKLKILISPKGVGKSCLIEETHSRLLDENTLSILITPSDFNIELVNSCSALSSKSNEFEKQLNQKIISILLNAAEEISIVDEDERHLLKCAVNDENIQCNNISVKLTKFISSIIPRSTDVVKGIMELDGYSKPSSISNSINNVIKAQQKKLFLFVDDIDRAATQAAISPNEKTKLNYSNCWAIVDALYQLTLSIPCINAVVCVRNDIWHTMERRGLGSDRRDKINDIIRLRMSDEDVERILVKRLDAAFDELSPKPKPGVNPFFESKDLVLPGKKEIIRKWTSFLAKTSRNKPRELVLFMQLILKEAKEHKITANHAYKAMAKYGKGVLARTYAEFADICPSLETITNVVLKKQIYDFTDYLKIVQTTPSIRRIDIDGKTMNANDTASAIEIMRVLHMANIVNPRIYDPTQPEGFAHVAFYDSPNFVSHNNIQELQKCQWEVHPAFYSMMDDDRQQSLPYKPWKKGQ